MSESDFWATVRRQFPEAKILQWDKGKRLVLKCHEEYLSQDQIDHVITILQKILGDDFPGPLVVVTPNNVTWHIGRETTPLEYVLGQRVKQLEDCLRTNRIPIPQDPVT